ncbi:MAG TPA: HlyD family efflux transporter periplasmic adaptor subunit [Gemmataceae bacterium]|jgi:multidrug resistance efflux pump
MKKLFGKFLLPLLAVGMLVFAIYHVVQAQQKPPKPPPPLEPARTPFGRTVAGAGIVEARSQNIAVGSALPGLVLKVWAPEELGRPSKPGMTPWEALIGQHVKQSDPLFRVDDRQLKAMLAFHEANLAAAQAQLAKLEQMPRKEELDVSKSKVEVAKATVSLQRDLAERDAKLVGSGSVPEEEYRQRRLSQMVAQRQLLQAEADLTLMKNGAWEPDKAIARAAIKLAEAQILQDHTDIDRAIVRAPMDGVVLQVNVRPGEYVGANPGAALVVLGAITDRVNVRVDIDEHDIPRFKPGVPAVASLRGAPDKKYPLTFVRVEPYVIPKKSLTGDNTERVDTRVLQVIYVLKTEGKPIYVGQQLDVFIDVGAAEIDKPVAPPESTGG